MGDLIEKSKEQEIVKIKKRHHAEIFCIVTWLYLVIKIFVFDFDAYFLYNYLPSLSWIINYKFFILLAFISICWMLLKTKKFLKLIGFLFIYPPFFIFYRIPKLLFKAKSWVGIFALIEIAISFFRSLKFNVIIFTAVAFSCLFILKTESKYLLIISIVTLFAYLINHFVRCFRYAFRPFNIFSIQSEKIIEQWKKLQDQFAVKNINKYNEKHEINEKWANNLQILIILNKICCFIILKLRNFQKSGFAIIYSLSSLIGTFFITIFVFTLQNLALSKLSPNSFVGSASKSFGEFFYYSFNTIFTHSGNELYPASTLARVFSCLEIFSGFLIVIIIVFLLLTIFREKHNEQINNAIMTIENQALVSQDFIRKEFSLNIDEAIQEIEKIKGALVKVIYFLMR
jgi:hypothetical protein